MWPFDTPFCENYMHELENYHGFASHVLPIHVRNTWFVLGVTIGNLHSNAFGIFFMSTFFSVFVIEVR